MGSKLQLPILAFGEYDKYIELYRDTGRTTTGTPAPFTASPSGYIYDITGTVYDNQGELGLMNLLYFGDSGDSFWDETHYVLENYNIDDRWVNYVEVGLDVITSVGGDATNIELNIDLPKYVAGRKYSFLASFTGVANTLNVGGNGVKPFYKQGTTDYPSLIANRVYTAWYDGATFFQLASASGTAIPSDVLAGSTASSDYGIEFEGTMNDYSGDTLTFPQGSINEVIISPSNPTTQGRITFDNLDNVYVGKIDGTTINQLSVNGLIPSNIRANRLIGNNVTSGNNRMLGTFTSGTTLIPSHALINETYGANGEIETGTMPNRAGNTSALSFTISGNTLQLLASNGYRDGIDDKVTITDNDWIEANILSTKEIFGKTGTLIGIGTSSSDIFTPYILTPSVSAVLGKLLSNEIMMQSSPKAVMQTSGSGLGYGTMIGYWTGTPSGEMTMIANFSTSTSVRDNYTIMAVKKDYSTSSIVVSAVRSSTTDDFFELLTIPIVVPNLNVDFYFGCGRNLGDASLSSLTVGTNVARIYTEKA